jgi:hypothetical protein
MRGACALLTSAAEPDMGGLGHNGNEGTDARAVRRACRGERKAKRAKPGEWGREDSNLRRQSQRVYSPSPLAAREHPPGDGHCSCGRIGG